MFEESDFLRRKSFFSSARIVPVFKKSSSWLSKLWGDKKGESSSSLEGIKVKKGNKTHRQRWKNYLWKMSRFSKIVLSDENFPKPFRADKFAVHVFESELLAQVNWDIKTLPSLRYLSFFARQRPIKKFSKWKVSIEGNYVIIIVIVNLSFSQFRIFMSFQIFKKNKKKLLKFFLRFLSLKSFRREKLLAV